ncbi:MAG: hypothetical protein J2O47_00300 [Acidimicrobiaceae bacterium]|nr:hypothetical protein [Acidimicrobiaceae bacterium]
MNSLFRVLGPAVSVAFAVDDVGKTGGHPRILGPWTAGNDLRCGLHRAVANFRP